MRALAIAVSLLLPASIGWAEPVTTIRNNGDPANRVDIVFLGDGYTAGELGKYAIDVENAVQGLFAQSPYSDYPYHFNVHRVDATSNQSGAGRYTPLDTAFKAFYFCGGIQRLICVDTSLVYAALGRTTLSASAREMIIVLVNDPEYGGSGGAVAVASTHPAVIELVLHETGHSFGRLADEYGYGPPACNSSFEPSEVNATRQTDRSLIKWRHWIADTTPIPTPVETGPGLYDGAKYCPAGFGLYRPTWNSKMRNLFRPFEQINVEQHIKRIYSYVSPIDSASPAGSSVTLDRGGSYPFSVATPLTPGGLNVTWRLDGVMIGAGPGITLLGDDVTSGPHTLVAEVSDPTPLVRSDPSNLLRESRQWSLFKLGARITSLTAAPSPPQPAGTPIRFTATSSGGVLPHQYKWFVFDGTTWVPVQDWGPATLDWTPTWPTSYSVGVWVRGADATAAEDTESTAFTITGFTSVSLGASVTPPGAPGIPVTFTATPAGALATPVFKWLVFDGAAWSDQTGWTASAQFVWTPPSKNPNYRVGVWVKSQDSPLNAAEAVASMAFPVAGVTAVSVTPDLAPPQGTGTTIVFTASATGGAPQQFKWYLFDGSAWTLLRDWDAAPALAWTPLRPNAAYRIGVWARSGGSTSPSAEATDSEPFAVTATPVTLTPPGGTPTVGVPMNVAATPGRASTWEYKWLLLSGGAWTPLTGWVSASTLAWSPTARGEFRIGVWMRQAGDTIDSPESAASVPFTVVGVQGLTLNANPPGPQPPNTAVTFTAVPTGGGPPLQYRWWFFDGSSWQPLTDWVPDATRVVTRPFEGSFIVGVWARSNGGTETEAAASTPLAIVRPRVSSVSLNAVGPAPQVDGAHVLLTATPTGGLGPIEYKWWLFDGAWTMLLDWSATPVFDWKVNRPPGTYRIGVWARGAGAAGNAADATQSIEIVLPRVTSVVLGSDVASPQPSATPILFTATAAGGVAPQEFKWYLFDGVTWAPLTGWSASNTYLWTPLLANANYRIGVWARSSGSPLDQAEFAQSLPFVIQ